CARRASSTPSRSGRRSTRIRASTWSPSCPSRCSRSSGNGSATWHRNASMRSGCGPSTARPGAGRLEGGIMSDFWGRLTVPEQAALATVASPSRFEADSTIINEHDATDHVLVIRSGLAKVSARIGANRDVLLALRRPGDIIGEMAGVADGRRSATIVAIDDVDALLIKADRFAAFLGQFAHASTVLHGVLVDRLRDCD